MTIIYYITLIVIFYMIYDLAYNRKDGFQHRGGEIMSTLNVDIKNSSTTSLIKIAISTSYKLAELMSRLTLASAHRMLNSIRDMMISILDYGLDMIKAYNDMFGSIIRPIWNMFVTYYKKAVEMYKSGMYTIRNFPAFMKENTQKGLSMLDSGSGQFSGFIGKMFKLALNIVMMLFTFPAKMLEKALEMTG